MDLSTLKLYKKKALSLLFFVVFFFLTIRYQHVVIIVQRLAIADGIILQIETLLAEFIELNFMGEIFAQYHAGLFTDGARNVVLIDTGETVSALWKE